MKKEGGWRDGIEIDEGTISIEVNDKKLKYLSLMLGASYSLTCDWLKDFIRAWPYLLPHPDFGGFVVPHLTHTLTVPMYLQSFLTPKRNQNPFSNHSLLYTLTLRYIASQKMSMTGSVSASL